MAKNKILQRQRNARGFGSTMIGSLANLNQPDSTSMLAKVLGG